MTVGSLNFIVMQGNVGQRFVQTEHMLFLNVNKMNKNKVIKVAVVTTVTTDNEPPYIEYDNILAYVDEHARYDKGAKDFFVALCKAAAKYVYRQKVAENKGCKVTSRFVDYEVLTISDMVYMSDLENDGYYDEKRKRK